LGKTFWEALAKRFASMNGFNIKDDDLQCPRIMPATLVNMLQILTESRLNQNGQYSAEACHSTIKQVCQQFINVPIPLFSKPSRGNGVDIWLEKDGINYFFDTKTVQPNVADFKKYLGQLLNWYGYYYSRYPTGTGFARMIFPFNPYNGDFWRCSKGKGRPLEPINEALVEDEFWNFISGEENTFDLIKEGFIELHDEGVFQNEFNQLFYNENN